MKAALIAHQIPVRKTHSIGLLLDLISEHTAVPKDVQEATILTDHAVTCRYPGDAEPVTESEYEQTVHLAETVLAWVVQIVG